MRAYWAMLLAVGLAVGIGLNAQGQSGANTAESHIAAAKVAAGSQQEWMFNRLCVQALADFKKGPQPPAAASGAPAGPPPRSTWYAPPVKVFDNVYRVGTIEHSAWAIKTSDGIILMDAIFDYNVKEEVIDGLKQLGMDPATIKYAIIGHAHGDHVGGARMLQDMYGTHIVLGADDWNLLERTGPAAGSAANMPKPKRDIVATDGMKITLGDTTVTVYVTPGHTLGTLSSIFPVKDHGTPHVVAYWGGTMFNWTGGSPQYLSPTTPAKFWFDTYAKSAARFTEIAAKAGADVIMSNHTDFDGTKVKEPKLATRGAQDRHPYVIGREGVQSYLTTVGECAQAGLALAN